MKDAAYHGIDTVKYFPGEDDGYSETPISVEFAKGLNPSVLVDAVEQYADNRLIFRTPKDNGYEAGLRSTAQDIEFEKSLGYVLEADVGHIKTNMVSYARGALYYEFFGRNSKGMASKIKAFLFNVEVGKSNEDYQTDEASATFGAYEYPLRVYGDPLMDKTGDEQYRDNNGVPRVALIQICRPDDDGYDEFGKKVPVPKVKAPAVEG